MKYRTSDILPDSYRYAKRALSKAGCTCSWDTIACLGIHIFEDWLDPDDSDQCNQYVAEHPDVKLHAYCIGCQKRIWFFSEMAQVFYVSPFNIMSLYVQAYCPHGPESWDISPWLATICEGDVFTNTSVARERVYKHKLYCRQCRKVFDVVFPYEDAIRRHINVATRAWY